MTTKKTKKRTSSKAVQKLENNIEKLEASISDLELQLKNLKDKNVRLLAEFENFKRRTVEEKTKLIRYSGEELILSILPVLDDLERTSENLSNNDIKILREAVSMIYAKLIKIFKDHKIEAFDSVGTDFDPNLHEALMNEEGENENIVLKEFEKGYKYHDRIIRHAKVVVSKEKK